MVAKLGLSLAQKTSAWLKACGKSSILQTRPIKPAELKGLKYFPQQKASCGMDTFELTTKASKNVSRQVITTGLAEPTVTILPNGTKVSKNTFSILNKNGQTNQFVLEKNIVPNRDNSIALEYNVLDENGRNCGYWNGLIGDLGGDSYMLGFNLKSEVSGIGSALKDFVKKDALANGCKKIKLNAAFESHMFHNKMGYKSAFEIEQLGSAKNILQSIKREGALPEFNKEIEQALNSENVREVNSLIDRILSHANIKKLWSDDIGIAEHRIPMEYIL